jgi:hypothetical protein
MPAGIPPAKVQRDEQADNDRDRPWNKVHHAGSSRGRGKRFLVFLRGVRRIPTDLGSQRQTTA